MQEERNAVCRPAAQNQIQLKLQLETARKNDDEQGTPTTECSERMHAERRGNNQTQGQMRLESDVTKHQRKHPAPRQ